MKPIALALALLAASAAPARAEAVHRFALVAGNDEGGPDTRPLLFAREDARKMYGLLSRLGGVAKEDARLLLNAKAQDFLEALTGVEEAAKGVVTTYGLQLFFSVPAQGSTEQIRLLAVHQDILNVEVIQ